MKKKTVALLLALVLVLGVAAGGTLAWLIDKTAPVTNTFTVGDINIELTESDGLDLKMVPSKTLAKDPKVTVKANSEACILFVQITKSANYDSFLQEYAVADGWMQLTGAGIPDKVYYRTVAATQADTEFQVLAGNSVTVKSDVTKTQLNALTPANYPTLTFTAYACQQLNGNTTFTPAEAWAKASAN